MRRSVLAVTFLFFASFSFAQADTVQLKQAVQALDRALLAKDTLMLVELLDDKVTFGHSNGWVETKQDILRDLRTGYLSYEKLESSNYKITEDNDWVSVRMNVAASGKVNEKPFDLKLYVLQVWKRVKNDWKLIARQSAKL